MSQTEGACHVSEVVVRVGTEADPRVDSILWQEQQAAQSHFH